ncbi:DUF4153 domain-containing protein [Aquisalinus flavus]|uniref:DUF4153 domain-containing protein n=1 Tax=Aquisalinus flavus TaxID=1526572 RepID=A0A8J2V5U9_9PROT|nr:DUF4153 domain-containing protein [Aquisalinus flavus]MBD0425403.1 DUF4153 domain-containing protein [Aquisalinus flavus]UNE48953.1 DUF4153 domain-containing protein [Aquisalinus flavus]GGD16327.1 DUF4153 domain-containing protein [Aquisalinus flavus]
MENDKPVTSARSSARAEDSASAVYASPLEAILFFLLPGFLQGVAFWYLTDRIDEAEPTSLIVAMMMAVMVVPVAHFLTTTRGTRVIAAAYALGLGVVIAGLYLLAEASFGASAAVEGPLVAISAVCGFLIAYISAPFFRTVIERREAPTHYPSLFEFAWNLPVIGIGTFFFGIALWIVLGLWSALFSLIGIEFFAEIFGEPWAAFPISGAAGAIAIAIVREREAIVLALRSVLFALLKVLAPILAVATVLFAFAALVQGLDLLWDNWSATTTMVCAVALAVALSNAVVGEAGQPDNPVLRWTVRVQAVVLPVLAGFAVYGLWIRIGEYGLTVERIYAAIIVGFAGAYAIAYFVSALLPSGWELIRRANLGLAGLVFLVAILVQTPLFNAWSWTVNDQIARLERGAVSADEFDYAYFHFVLGKAGERGLDRLAADTSLPDHDLILEKIEAVRAAENQWDFRNEIYMSRDTIAAAIEDGSIELLPSGTALPPGLADYFRNTGWSVRSCVDGNADACLLLRTEVFNADDQFVLFRQFGETSVSVALLADGAEGWQIHEGTEMQFDSRAAALAFLQAVRNGELAPATVTLRTLSVGGRDVLINHLGEAERRLLEVQPDPAIAP